MSAPLRRKPEMARSLTNMTRTIPPKPPQRPNTAGDKPKRISESFKHLLTGKYPPYDPEEFAPRDTKSDSELCPTSVPRSDKELLIKIREELDEWTAECSKQKKCPEEWTSVPESTYLDSPFSLCSKVNSFLTDVALFFPFMRKSSFILFSYFASILCLMI